MENKRYKPLVDLAYSLVWASAVLPTVAAVVAAIFHPPVFFVAVPTFLFVAYFVLSPLFGYVELREDSLFIKFGFFLSREIPYSKIRRVERDRKFYSESMLSLKSALEHVNVGYGSFDVVTVSVLNNDELVRELELRCGAPSE